MQCEGTKVANSYNCYRCKNNFERRIGLWLVYYNDEDGILFIKTFSGHFPHYLDGQFTGWMLLNYSKPIWVSSWLLAHPTDFAVDEDI